MIVLELDMPPSSNRLWRTGRGRTYIAPEYKNWLKASMCQIAALKLSPIVGHFRLSIDLRRKDKRRRDLDNYQAGPMDLLQKSGLIQDDCLCDELIARWVTTGPDCKITVEKIDG